MSNNNDSLQVYIVMDYKGITVWKWLQEKKEI